MQIATRVAALFGLLGIAVAPLHSTAAETAPGTLQFSAASYEVEEGTPTLVVTVTRTNGSDGKVSTRVSTSDIRALAHQDYTPISVKVVFVDGDSTAKTVSIPILDDTLAEGDQPLRLSLGAPSGGALLGTHGTATVTIIDDEPPPTAPVLSVSARIKQLRFSWSGGVGASHYRLSRSDLGPPGQFLPGNVSSTTREIAVHRLDWPQARYRLSACNPQGCTDSNEIDVVNQMLGAIGYFKASNTDSGDRFGKAIALSADGNTLAVGAWAEASNATLVEGDQNNNDEPGCGAVYVFTRGASGKWSQQAYLKGSDPDLGKLFGNAVTLSADGNTLAVGARNERHGAPSGESGAVYVFSRLATQWSQQAHFENPSADPWDPHFGDAVALSADGNTLAAAAPHESSHGAVYVFARAGTAWSQQARVTGSNTELGDVFGADVALSADGDTLAVGAPHERSRATGIDGDQTDNSGNLNGAVYVFQRTAAQWTQQAYVKGSTTTDLQRFGNSVALSGNAARLAVGAPGDRSSATGIDGDEYTLGDLAPDSGAVHVFSRTLGQWTKEAYIKASNTDDNDTFGESLALSADGSTLGVGAVRECSSATGIDGNQLDNSSGPYTGAAYVFERNGSSWSQRAYVKASNTETRDTFGLDIALSDDGSTLAVSAWHEGSAARGVGGAQSDNSAAEAGAVYLY